MKKILAVFFVFALLGCEKPNGNNTPPPNNPEVSRQLKVGAFNIQIFGTSKMSKPEVVASLLQILPRYDLVLIQEIRDSSGVAIQDLLSQLNAQTSNQYQMIIGSRVGRTSSKEQYAYFYKPSKLTVMDSFEYEDGPEPDGDVFEREPFLVQFNFIATNTSFFAVGIHTQPSNALVEIEALEDVFWSGVSRWNDYNAIILGDLNADCSYLSDGEYNSLSLVQDSRFSWHISKNNDSTVSTSTNCAYDNIITTNFLSSSVAADSAQVFNFKDALGLSQTAAADVSDHYPVEILFNF